MRIKNLTLDNFVCFKGEQSIELEPLAYAVTAAHSIDQDRSNWLGKSTFLESIVFALFGEHRYRTEDSWITHDERAGGVTLVTDTGLTIERRRHRGKATRLSAGSATGEEAQHLINEAIGLSHSDFCATCYFEQKRMDSFLTMDPSVRMKKVVGWLRLEKLDDCLSSVSAGLGKLLDQTASLQQQVAIKNAILDNLVLTIPAAVNPKCPERFIEEIESVTLDLEKAKARVKELEERFKQAVLLAKDEQDSHAYQQVVEEGKRLKAELMSLNLPDLEAKVEEATKTWSQAEAMVREARIDCESRSRVALGEFDGCCPVAGTLCPVKDAINADRVTSRSLYEQSYRALNERLARLNLVDRQRECARLALSYARELDAKIGRLRERAKVLQPAANRFAAHTVSEGDDNVTDELRIARGTVADLESWINSLRTSHSRYVALSTEVQQFKEQMDTLASKVGTHQEALTVFRHARRMVAEGALSVIEQRSNAMLVQSGIDLSLVVQWARETQGLADTCDSCGNAFGKSAKIKVCSRCGGVRGPKMTNKLEIIPSNRSGAAEDLAGGAFQLSASAWLRQQRACAWSTALIDEPFGSLDAANRQAFSSHLSGMLRAFGFDQVFVVAHHAGLMDAMPGRVEITSSNGRSLVRS